MVRLVSLSVLLTLIIFLGITFYQVVAPFLLPLFLAAVLAILCEPLFMYYRRRTGDRVQLAASLTTATVIASILIPFVLGTFIGSVQLYTLSHKLLEQASWQKLSTSIQQNYGGLLEMLEPIIPAEIFDSTDAPPLLPPPIEESAARESNEAVPGETPASESAEANTAANTTEAKPPGENDAAAGEPASTAEKKTDAVAAPAVTEGKTADSDAVNNDATTAAATTSEVPADAEPPADETQATATHYKGELETKLREGLRSLMISLAKRSLGLANSALGLLGSAAALIISAMLFTLALYYFLADGPKLLTATQNLIPVHVEYQQTLFKEFVTVVRSVVISTFVAAISQGLATSCVLFILGFSQFFIIFIVATISAMIPLAGTWLVWGPCALWLVYEGSWGAAIFLTLFGVVVIGLMDNIIRTYMLQSDTKLHPLLAFVSVLGGLQAMGLWGVFIGPIVASCLHALVEIFNKELIAFSQEKLTELSIPVEITGTSIAIGGNPADKGTEPADTKQPTSANSDAPTDAAPAEEGESSAKNPRADQEPQS